MDRTGSAIRDSTELLELSEHDGDAHALAEIERDVLRIDHDVYQLEFKRMFRGEMDTHSCFLDIQAGAGGTEAQDWAQMLMRMYIKWSASRGFECEVMDSSPGDVAGMKSATLNIRGEYAYGWLRTEIGVHRLVR